MGAFAGQRGSASALGVRARLRRLKPPRSLLQKVRAWRLPGPQLPEQGRRLGFQAASGTLAIPMRDSVTVVSILMGT